MKQGKIFQLLGLVILLSRLDCSAQVVSAYSDYQDHFQVFDRGQYRQLEYIKVHSYKVGGNTVAYIDNKNDFKIYYNGETYPMLNAADFSYQVSDHLTAFSVGSVLYVFDEGEKKILTHYGGYLNLNDSLLVFYDEPKSTLNIYYNHEVIDVEDALLSLPKKIRTGSNIAAWEDQSNIFSVFYHGKTIELDNIPPIIFECGRDIMAYVDDYERRFRLFYYGDTAMIDEYPPDSFKVGFGIMAYVDNLGNFKIFCDGALKKILSDRPDFFEVKGNVVVYSYNNTFNIFYDNEITTLQSYTPENFQLGNDGIAWIGDNGRLMLFNRGQTFTVSYEMIKKYFLNGDVLKYEVGVNTVYVFYKGKNY